MCLPHTERCHAATAHTLCGLALRPLAVLLVVLSAKKCTDEAAHMSRMHTSHHALHSTCIIVCLHISAANCAFTSDGCTVCTRQQCHTTQQAVHFSSGLQSGRQWLGKQDLHPAGSCRYCRFPQRNRLCNNSDQHAAAAMSTELPKTAAAITNVHNAYQGGGSFWASHTTATPACSRRI